jgi:KaiC/GvpD/RAD55 family RecA-like ATPase
MDDDSIGLDPLGPSDNELLLVLLFVEHVNTVFASQIASRKKAVASPGWLAHIWRRLPSNLADWSPRSDTYELVSRAGIPVVTDLRVLERVMAVLARTHPRAGSDASPFVWAKNDGSRLPSLAHPEALKERLFIYDAPGRGSFSNTDHLGAQGIAHPTVAQRDLKAVVWDEFLDPLSVLRRYLLAQYGVPETLVGHQIQQWIMRCFQIPSTKEIRYALANVVLRFNQLFYGVRRPTKSELRVQRSATVGLGLLVEQVADVLRNGAEGPDAKTASLRNAVGVVLFMRLHRLLRVRFHWLGNDSEPLAPSPRAKKLSGEARRQQELDAVQLRNACNHRQCVSVLRPLEYTYAQTSMFGIKTGISGLNYVFRGGLLPRVDGGRSILLNGPPGSGKTVLALQLLADLASKGAVCIYFSFEEDYDSIVDRLVTFDLLERSYRVEMAETWKQVGDLVRELHPQSGLLLFFQVASGDEYSLPTAVREIGDIIGDGRQKALVLDSVNALRMRPPRANDPSQRKELRRSLVELVQEVNAAHFLGFFITERDDASLQVLPYLADTVIELTNVLGMGRRLHITKCRSQHFYEGPHSYRLTERKGVTIYPSLSAVENTLRRRVQATLSQTRIIPLPHSLRSLFPPAPRQRKNDQATALTAPARVEESSLAPGEESSPAPAGEKAAASVGRQRKVEERVGIEEKSATLIFGGTGAGKSLFALQLLTEPSIRRPGEDQGFRVPYSVMPRSILVVTFKTPEVRFNQLLRRHVGIDKRWKEIPLRPVRWFSPGDGLSGDQILSALRHFITYSKREGLPIERVFFDNTEMAERLIPALAREPLFWPTLLELMRTEAITAFFVVTEDEAETEVPPVMILKSQVDYCLRLDAVTKLGEEKGGKMISQTKSVVEVVNLPHFKPDGIGRTEILEFSENGLIL